MVMLKVYRNEDNSYQAAVWHQAGKFVVTEWRKDEDQIATVESFEYEGPRYGKDSLAARATAHGFAKTLADCDGCPGPEWS